MITLAYRKQSSFVMVILIITHTLIDECQMQDLSDLITKRKCRERNRLINTDKNDLYSFVEVPIDEKLMLQCHYCFEDDDHQPKNWYRANSFINTTMREVTLDMETNITINKIYVNMDHTLVINNVEEKDRGLYLCVGLDGQESENKYNYLIDIVFDKNYTFETGNLTAWRKYQADYLQPLNDRFKKSAEHDFKRLRRFLTVEIVTDWESWGPCELCGRPVGDGRKTRIGYCRLKLHRHSREEEKNTTFTNRQLFILNSNEISCRSTLLSKEFPIISNLTRVLPYFIQYEHCDGTCNPDAEGIYKGWKSTKKGYKYKKTFVLAEGSHLSIVCPESTLENVVKWRKDGKELKRGTSHIMGKYETEPTISIDTFNTIYFHDVTMPDEGNYTCDVDTVRMQQVRIFIVSKSKLLTQAFVRHLMYLGFVLSLTLSCYCGGLFLTWRRRHKFKTYKELKLLNKFKDDASSDDEYDFEESAVEVRSSDIETDVETDAETNVDHESESETWTKTTGTKTGKTGTDTEGVSDTAETPRSRYTGTATETSGEMDTRTTVSYTRTSSDATRSQEDNLNLFHTTEFDNTVIYKNENVKDKQIR